MKYLNIYLLLILLTSFLSSCTTSSSEQEGPDPLAKHQWYLFNVGQSGITATESGGVTGEDMRGFSSNNLNIGNYAKGYTGSGVEIAIIDSGLEIKHEDLVKNVIFNGSYNFGHASNNKGRHDTTATGSDGDHGTSVAGIAAARGNNTIGVFGVAPKARLRGFNLLTTQSLDAELAALGFQNSVANFVGMKSSSVSVFNKSYGRNPNIPQLENAEQLGLDNILGAMKLGTEQLRQGKGALYIKAAGNEYEGGAVFSDAYCSQSIRRGVTCYNANQEFTHITPFQIVVGAFNAKGKRASYSNTGSALWISGAGGEFGNLSPAMMTVDKSGCDEGYSKNPTDSGPNTAFNRGTIDENIGCNYYSAFNGTSSATPTISGAIALILSANPSASWSDVKYILAKTARKINPNLAEVTMTLGGNTQVIEQKWIENNAGFNFSNEFGFGALDIIASVSLAEQREQSQTHVGRLINYQQPEQNYTTLNTIPDASSTGLAKSINVFATGLTTVESVELIIDISAITASATRIDNKIDASDYLIELTSPAGTKSIVMTPFNAFLSGYAMDNFKMISHAFYGESITGNWIVKITDVDGSTSNHITHVGSGKLNKLGLNFYGH